MDTDILFLFSVDTLRDRRSLDQISWNIEILVIVVTVLTFTLKKTNRIPERFNLIQPIDV